MQLHRTVPSERPCQPSRPSLVFLVCLYIPSSSFRISLSAGSWFKYFRYRVMIGCCSMYHWPKHFFFRIQMEIVAGTLLQ